MTTLVVVATGNHFILDAVAGTLLAGRPGPWFHGFPGPGAGRDRIPAITTATSAIIWRHACRRRVPGRPRVRDDAGRRAGRVRPRWLVRCRMSGFAGEMRAGGGDPRRGLWLTFLSPFGLELAGGCGAEWIGIDIQHGDLGIGDVAPLARVSPVPVLVRLGSHDEAQLARVLDAGSTA